MSEYSKIRNQIVKLQRQAEILRKRERTEIIAKIKEAIAAYEFTAEDLGLSSARLHNPAKKLTAKTNQHGRGPERRTDKKSSIMDRRGVVAPKYRDLTTGATWTGRGKQPKWLAAAIKGGKKLEDFKI